MRSVAEAAYLAGFVDGEGSIGVYKHGRSFRLRMQVANTSYPVLEHLQKIWGGRISHNGTKERNPRWKPSYILDWNTNQILSLLKEIQPYLVNKAEHCITALEFQDTVLPKHPGCLGLPKKVISKRLSLREKFKELNCRGVPQ